jgi:hypothetical protein
MRQGAPEQHVAENRERPEVREFAFKDLTLEFEADKA